MMYMKSHEAQFMMRFCTPRLEPREKTGLPVQTVL